MTVKWYAITLSVVSVDSKLGTSRGAAAALFVLFAGAAGAGVVAADFRAGADLLRRFRFLAPGLELQILLRATLPALDLFGFFFRTRGLHEVEEANRFRVDAPHHVFEKLESLFFELDQRIHLTVATQADAFL